MATVYNINNNKYIVIEPNDILYIFEKECSPELATVLRELITDRQQPHTLKRGGLFRNK